MLLDSSEIALCQGMTASCHCTALSTLLYASAVEPGSPLSLSAVSTIYKASAQNHSVSHQAGLDLRETGIHSFGLICIHDLTWLLSSASKL